MANGKSSSKLKLIEADRTDTCHPAAAAAAMSMPCQFEAILEEGNCARLSFSPSSLS